MLGVLFATALLHIAPIQDLPKPANAAELDSLLAAEDYTNLVKALSNAQDGDALFLNMNWERDTTLRGATVFVTFLYIRDLKRMAASMPADEGAPMRDTAGMMSLIAYATISIDKAYCADATAAGHRLNQLMEIAGTSFAELKAMPLETRRMLLDFIPRAEQMTAKSRLRDGYDSFICRGGMMEMMTGLRAGAPKEVPTPPGGIGRTFTIDPGTGYKPPRADPEKAASQIAEARAKLPSVLANMLGLDD
ncbi:MAG: hypothetical protein EON93_18530 [Burkholderiales bacterium]|nr:MAG: hypothetical protein EON93_18530 [Burkholderiales bacterium]